MKRVLTRLFEHQYLEREQAKQILADIANGKYNNEQISAFITIFLMRSISVEELVGFRDALLSMCTPVDLSEYKPVDIVGTGGDGKNTFNISTASCFVLAGAGYNVTKHGNYSATSVSGSSNVLEQHGVKFTKDIEILRRSLDECNIAYLHAPLFNPAMKSVAPIRKSLGVRTFFNILGPLINPAKPTFQLLGVYNLSLFRLYRYTYEAGNMPFAIVHSIEGYDEISLTSEFKVIMCGKENVYTPEMIGMKPCNGRDLWGGNTVKAASVIFDNIMNNSATQAQHNCVLANSAFAIRVICPEKSIEECIAEARESLESGNALKTFKKFIEINS